ncbi:MAG: isoprenylcysteine carboxylmethyltransferase family protein [Spirochaetaceae bacterium]|nr:MAG: isoprenylcysteine carboxylmethyltransferase family protein [Spirochaetaceae bacterium]
MTNSEIKIVPAAIKLLLLDSITAVLLFASSGTFAWPGPWIILGMDLFYLTVLLVIGMKYFPETVKARSQTRFVHIWDKIAILIYILGFYSGYVIAGLDTRYFLSEVHPLIFAAGIFLYTAGIGITFWVLAANPYATGSSRVQADRNQKVISSGPYRILRHPMYFATILFAIATPLVLESVWAFLPAPLVVCSFIYRCYREDTMLQKSQIQDAPLYLVTIEQRIRRHTFLKPHGPLHRLRDRQHFREHVPGLPGSHRIIPSPAG